MFGKSRFKQLGLALLLGGACACGQQKATGIDFDSAGLEGFDETHFDLLAADCSFDGSGNMIVTVGTDETAYLFKRAADSVVVANANIAGVECTVATTKRITINGGAGDQKVILDFYSGTFGLATASSGPNIVIVLGAGEGDTVKMRGTPNADLVTFGTNGTTGTSYAAISVVGATPVRTTPDISMTGVESVVVSTGAGNDVITGQGGAPLGGSAVGPLAGAISMTIYGGDGNDTITSGGASPSLTRNSLNGGAGNDFFPQQALLAADTISGGADIDTVDYSARASAVRVSLGVGISAAAATGSLTCVAKASIADNDSFVLDDGPHAAKTFAYQVTADAYATGSFTCVAKAALVDNDWFVLTDGTKTVTFEYDVSGDAVALQGGTLIDVSSATDAPSVAALTYTAINSAHTADSIDLTPTDPLATAVIALTADVYGAGSAITEHVANAGFTVVAMSGGSVFVESAENIAASATIIDISGATTAAQVATATYTVVDAANGGSFAITATDPAGSAVIALVNDATGAAGNVAITKSTGAAFTVTGMSGGVTAMTYDDGDIALAELDSIGADIENVIGSSAGDTIDASASGVAHVLMGMAGNDTLIGAGLVDYLYGGAGDDTLKGGGGADFLFGGNDNDVVQGGLGNDTINGGGANCLAAVSAAAPVVPYVSAVCTSAVAAASTTAGIDTLDYSDRTVGTQAVYADLSSLNCTGHTFGEISTAECDVIVSSGTPAVASVRNIRGGAGADTLKGDARDNIIWGGDGGDHIYGGLGNDALYGQGGNDDIYGNDGLDATIASTAFDNDFISGGTGMNTLYGDDGLDTIDSSQGSGDTVVCGKGDGDINLPSGDETSIDVSCEL